MMWFRGKKSVTESSEKEGGRKDGGRYVLIADNGATKCDWAAIGPGGKVDRFETQGVNLALSAPDEIVFAVHSAFAQFAALHASDRLVSLSTSEDGKTCLTVESVSEIWFYSAGATSGKAVETLEYAFGFMFPKAVVNVLSDLLGAARALCGTEPGIVGILGTGSNSCFYDGKDIVKAGHGGGFILGDEGSGAWFGKTLLADYVRNLIPKDMLDALQERYSLDYETVIEKVYRSEAPSRYLASFFPFIYKWARPESEGEFDDMEVTVAGQKYAGLFLCEGIMTFFDRCLHYQDFDFERYPVYLCGSIAWLCRNEIEHRASSLKMTVGKIVKSPIDGLIEYHFKNEDN